MTFTVGFKVRSRMDHVTVEAEDALAAALAVKERHPDAMIIYARPQNRRGDARHPVQDLHPHTGTDEQRR